MSLTAVCMTYRRPRVLKNAIACFAAQDSPRKNLVILDDAGLYRTDLDKIVEGERWANSMAIISTTRRYNSLDEKWQAAAHFAVALFPSTKALIRWDDDDVFLPGFMQAVQTTLDSAVPCDLVLQSEHTRFDCSKVTFHAPHVSHPKHVIKRHGICNYHHSLPDFDWHAIRGISLDGPADLIPEMDGFTSNRYAAHPQKMISADVE